MSYLISAWLCAIQRKSSSPPLNKALLIIAIVEFEIEAMEIAGRRKRDKSVLLPKRGVGLPTRKEICSERRTAPKSNHTPHFPTYMPDLSDNRQMRL
jgi:hypothetical protein